MERSEAGLLHRAGVATDYSKVSVPKALFERLRDYVEAHPELGYRSASEAAADAIRRRLEELEQAERFKDLEREAPAGKGPP